MNTDNQSAAPGESFAACQCLIWSLPFELLIERLVADAKVSRNGRL